MSQKENKKDKTEPSLQEPAANELEGQERKIEESEELAEGQKKEYAALWDRFLRLQAEFDNYKKRSAQDKNDFIKFANHGLIIELVGILDSFELSIKYAEQKNDFKLMHEGVDMIIRQLHTLLKAKGLEKIKTIGEKFDPHRHDALEIVEDSEVESEEVVDELQPGYLLSGRVLRPAKVKVAKPKEAKEKDNQKEAESKD